MLNLLYVPVACGFRDLVNLQVHCQSIRLGGKQHRDQGFWTLWLCSSSISRTCKSTRYCELMLQIIFTFYATVGWNPRVIISRASNIIFISLRYFPQSLTGLGSLTIPGVSCASRFVPVLRTWGHKTLTYERMPHGGAISLKRNVRRHHRDACSSKWLGTHAWCVECRKSVDGPNMSISMLYRRCCDMIWVHLQIISRLQFLL